MSRSRTAASSKSAPWKDRREGLPELTIVIGVNFGRVGFLSAMGRDAMEEGLKRAFAGERQIVSLPTLEINVDGIEAVAVNDAVCATSAIGRMVGIIDSMTRAERAKPELIKATRKRRIAAGAGVQVQEVNRMLAQYDQMQSMMKKLKGGGMMKMMRGMKGMIPGMR